VCPAAFGTRTAFRRGEQRDRDVLLSDLFAGRQALRHHAEGEQDWTTIAMTNRAWQDGFLAIARTLSGRGRRVSVLAIR
jgi:hypothetical protein